MPGCLLSVKVNDTEETGLTCFGSIGAKSPAISAETDGARKDPQMAYVPNRLRQDPQYDLFLQAAVGDDVRGTSVTVLSMLARLGVDPWVEAATLTHLKEVVARQRLEALLGRFTDVPLFGPALDMAVSRLIACLPRVSKDVPTPRPTAISIYWLAGIGLLLAYAGLQAHGN
ncbi:hypothetical protein SAMN05444272_4428 [Roseibium suaedae]|uniref:Uncharacterized protein n=2 Tax=Roseibium suaedae TaxID=735517 RepID=A0A1M7PIA8_9HYPH|nr:hypothetical protein SAMN05444272_4428 [Roseibium suaedae]